MLPRTLAEQRQVPRSRRRRRYCTMQCLLQPDISFARTWQGTPRLTQCWDAGDSECSSDVATDFGLRRARSPHAREARELQRRTFFCSTPLLRPSTPRSQCSSSKSRQQTTLKPKVQATDYGGRRLGGSASCAAPRRSLNSKGSPSTLAVCARGRDRRLAARARAAAKESQADQRVTYAAVALERSSGGAARARLQARSISSAAAHSLAEVCGYATLGMDGFRRTMSYCPGPPGHALGPSRHGKVVEEGKQGIGRCLTEHFVVG